MVLYSLLAMCERHDVNPEVYLADVLLRLQDQPKDTLAELLPHRCPVPPIDVGDVVVSRVASRSARNEAR
jgi:hypothetical protein